MSGAPRRSYSHLNPATGRIELVDPQEPAPSAKKTRTHLETDDEAADRLFGSVHGYTRGAMPRGAALDSELKRYGLWPRKYIEETE